MASNRSNMYTSESNTGSFNMSFWHKSLAVGAAFILIFMIILAHQLWYHVNANEIVVIQAPYSGKLEWITSPGLYFRMFGTVTVYHKRNIYEFKDKVRFNDGGHADMVGSIQYDMPLDTDHLTLIHTKFGTQEAVDVQLIKTVVDKSVYMSGPLMSSKESYAEKRNALIWYVEDQAKNGIYRTVQTEQRTKDPITDQEKTITVVTIVQNGSQPDRQEDPVWPMFGIKPFNFVITNLIYDDQVEAQIKQQQQITMDVQTAMAEAKKAEQRAVTVEKQGEALAMQSKWEQEVVKAKAVTQAQQEKEVAETQATQRLNVAKLDAQAADQYRIAQLSRAEGDATYQRKMLEANGALQQKLDAYVKVNSFYAQAVAQHQGPWVPSVVMGNANGSTSANGASQLIDLLTAQTAKQLSLDLSIPDGSRK